MVDSTKLTEQERAELLDYVSACQSAYHIHSTPGHRFGGLTSCLQENRDALVNYVESILQERSAQGTDAAVKTLNRLGYTWRGGELWAPPIGPVPLRFRDDFQAIKVALQDLVGARSKNELQDMRAALTALPVQPSELAVLLNAIDALLALE